MKPIYIILGGGLIYYFYNKCKKDAAPAPVPTSAPIIKAVPAKPKQQPKVILPKQQPAPNFVKGAKLTPKLPYKNVAVYNTPEGKVITNATDFEYIGYSPLLSNWILGKIVTYTGLYKAPNIVTVWSKANFWEVAKKTV